MELTGKFYVTAKSFAINRETGKSNSISNANQVKPKAADQAAFIIINASTPALTALPMSGPMGFLMAFSKGGNIIHPNNAMNAPAYKILRLLMAINEIEINTRR